MSISTLPKYVKEKIVNIEGESSSVEAVKNPDVKVWEIADLHNTGLSIQKIADTFQGLSVNEVKAALFYYKRNRKRINQQIRAHK
ncbi:MAG: DUF433 domain-containing protein [Candidatus Bipolaricaulota bacterium]|nr:DUF433 domain-containing protein [Candidatus Bipolaricaulota bacterium]